MDIRGLADPLLGYLGAVWGYGRVLRCQLGFKTRPGVPKRRNYQFDAPFWMPFWAPKSAYGASVLGCHGSKTSETTLNTKIDKKIQKNERLGGPFWELFGSIFRVIFDIVLEAILDQIFGRFGVDF